jgi:predicted MPP superfamily phosphohydrolase
LPGSQHPAFFALSVLVTAGSLWVFHAWGVASVPWLARYRRPFAVALAVLFAVDRFSDLLIIHRHDETAGLVHSALVLVFTTMVLSAAPVAAILGAARLVGRQARRRTSDEPARSPDAGAASDVPVPEVPAPEVPTAPAMTRRQVIETVGGAAIYGATGSMLGWGMIRGRHAFTLEEVPLRIPGLPRALDGYVIAQISDLHTGAFVADRELDEGLALVRAARPDLVVVTGDLVDFDAAFAPLVSSKLGELRARDGVTAILGNHDYYAGADEILEKLRGAGIDTLRDSGKIVRGDDGGGFALLGVDDLSSVRHGRAGPRLDLALASVPPDRPRILLSHQPASIDHWPGQVAAQLSGHTHGGQINPGFSPLGLFMKYVSGPYEVGGTTLYVNRGFGTVGAPARVGAPPEVTRFVLVSA